MTFLGPALQTLPGSEFEQRREIMQSVAVVFLELNTFCILVISQCGKRCGNELNLVNSFFRLNQH